MSELFTEKKKKKKCQYEAKLHMQTKADSETKDELTYDYLCGSC